MTDKKLDLKKSMFNFYTWPNLELFKNYFYSNIFVFEKLFYHISREGSAVYIERVRGSQVTNYFQIILFNKKFFNLK